MPSEPQIMLLDTILKEAGGMGHANHNILKSSYQTHDHSIYKPGATATFDVGDTDNTTQTIDIDSAKLKVFYSRFVKRSEKSIPGSGFSEDKSASLDYALAPVLGVDAPPGLEENVPGSLGSTIVDSGLGPNVNIHPIDNILERVMVDPNYPGSTTILDPYHNQDGSTSPKTTSDLHSSKKSMPPGSLGDYLGNY